MLLLRSPTTSPSETICLTASVSCRFKAEIGAQSHDVALVADEIIELILPVQTGVGQITLEAARPGGRPRKINIRAVLNAIFYLLRTGCQWRLLPREFPGWSTVYHYFRAWKNAGVWTYIQRSIYRQARRQADRAACPSVVIMDGQSVKTTERGGIRGFDAHKRVKGRKRHILVDTL